MPGRAGKLACNGDSALFLHQVQPSLSHQPPLCSTHMGASCLFVGKAAWWWCKHEVGTSMHASTAMVMQQVTMPRYAYQLQAMDMAPAHSAGLRAGPRCS